MRQVTLIFDIDDDECIDGIVTVIEKAISEIPVKNHVWSGLPPKPVKWETIDDICTNMGHVRRDGNGNWNKQKIKGKNTDICKYCRKRYYLHNDQLVDKEDI